MTISRILIIVKDDLQFGDGWKILKCPGFTIKNETKIALSQLILPMYFVCARHSSCRMCLNDQIPTTVRHLPGDRVWAISMGSTWVHACVFITCHLRKQNAGETRLPAVVGGQHYPQINTRRCVGCGARFVQDAGLVGRPSKSKRENSCCYGHMKNIMSGIEQSRMQ